jgi:hypothetical protein
MLERGTRAYLERSIPDSLTVGGDQSVRGDRAK